MKTNFRLPWICVVLLMATAAGRAQEPQSKPPTEVPSEVKDNPRIEAQAQNAALRSQLEHLTQNWDKVLQTDTRFVILRAFNGEAVRDDETGLVWERSPNESPVHFWNDARQICMNKTVGGRRGWRLPSVHELASLLDDGEVNPALPFGSPFNISNGGYYSATMDPTIVNNGIRTSVWAVDFGLAGVRSVGNDVSGHVWCVRGGGLLSEH